MKRIYQGRIVGVAIRRVGGTSMDLPDWPEALQRQHEIFQTAVNYYFVALAGMAAGLPPEHPLHGWREELRRVWNECERGSTSWSQPFAEVARTLGLPAQASLEQCTAEMFRHTASDESLRANALLDLATRKGDLSVLVGDTFGFLCAPPGQCDKTAKDAGNQRYAEAQRLLKTVLVSAPCEIAAAAKAFDPYLLLPKEPADIWTAKQTRGELQRRFAEVAAEFSELGSAKATWEAHLTSLGRDFVLRSPGRKTKGVFNPALLFHVWPTDITLNVLRRATSGLIEQTIDTGFIDQISRARVNDTPVFPFFTNLAVTAARDASSKQAGWFELDKAAMVEALNYPRRYLADSEERERERARVSREIADVLGRGRTPATDDEGSDTGSHGFANDERFQAIERLVGAELAWKAEDDSTRREYGIRERTLRHYKQVVAAWRALGEAPSEQALLDEVTRLQGKHSRTFGSADLYRALAKPPYRAIWRAPVNPQPWHAANPLELYRELQDLRREERRLSEPIRFTPAHPVHSPRFFTLPKDPQGKKNHVPLRDGDVMHLDVELLLPTCAGQAALRRTPVRIAYSAPRLLRDGLRRAGETPEMLIKGSLWEPPLAAGFTGSIAPDRQNFARTPAELVVDEYPESHNVATRFRLAFAVAIETKELVANFGPQLDWSKQLAKVPKAKSETFRRLIWKADSAWQKLDDFRILSVDAGTRHSATWARLVAAAANGTPTSHDRRIGVTAAGVEWRARLEHAEAIRLPGEDATTWRARSPNDRDDTAGPDFRIEPWGSRGRPALTDETQAARQLFRALLGDDTTAWPVDEMWEQTLSFPEQNDRLLTAASWAQARLRRLSRWGWMSNDPAKRNEACADIESLPSGYPISVATKTAAAQRDAAALHDALHSDWSQLRAALPSLLVEIANRTAPLRDRMWQWIVLPRRPDDAHDLHRLSDTGPMPRSKVRVRGQRGISVTRLTQLTRLRMRFQSLNQALRRPFGTRFAAASFADKARIPEVAPRLLDKIDELKTQRINQTANQILAAALGLELKSPDPATQSTRLTRDIHGLYQKRTDREGRPWKPVDFIVVEDLSRYRTAQTRSRSENKRLVDWCHREAVKKLKELAEPFGLKVVEANPSYTSKFSGWTGIAGFRAEEIAPADLEAWPWNEQIEAAARSNEPTDDEKALLRCAQWLRMLNVGRPREKHLRLVVPRDGGSRFVPAWPEPGEPERDPTRHADVGAAHNVGLRAIGALTEATIHPYVSSKSGRQSKKKANAPIDGRFFEVSGQAADAHTLPGDPFPSIPRSKFDEVVGRQKWPRCEAINRQRMRRWHLKFGTPLPEDEDEISV